MTIIKRKTTQDWRDLKELFSRGLRDKLYYKKKIVFQVMSKIENIIVINLDQFSLMIKKVNHYLK